MSRKHNVSHKATPGQEQPDPRVACGAVYPHPIIAKIYYGIERPPVCDLPAGHDGNHVIHTSEARRRAQRRGRDLLFGMSRRGRLTRTLFALVVGCGLGVILWHYGMSGWNALWAVALCALFLMVAATGAGEAVDVYLPRRHYRHGKKGRVTR